MTAMTGRAALRREAMIGQTLVYQTYHTRTLHDSDDTHGCSAPVQCVDLLVLVVTTSRTLPYRVT